MTLLISLSENEDPPYISTAIPHTGSQSFVASHLLVMTTLTSWDPLSLILPGTREVFARCGYVRYDTVIAMTLFPCRSSALCLQWSSHQRL